MSALDGPFFGAPCTAQAQLLCSPSWLLAAFDACGCSCVLHCRLLYIWLQYRNMPSTAEVAFSIAGAYLSFYISQVTQLGWVSCLA
jgi:hypothetical protein